MLIIVYKYLRYNHDVMPLIYA